MLCCMFAMLFWVKKKETRVTLKKIASTAKLFRNCSISSNFFEKQLPQRFNDIKTLHACRNDQFSFCEINPFPVFQFDYMNSLLRFVRFLSLVSMRRHWKAFSSENGIIIRLTCNDTWSKFYRAEIAWTLYFFSSNTEFLKGQMRWINRNLVDIFSIVSILLTVVINKN